MGNDDEPGQRPWLRTLHHARENCRERVADAMMEVDETGQALWPRPEGRLSKSRPQRTALAGHVSVIDYADHIRPFRTDLEPDDDDEIDLWKESIADIELPASKPIQISLENLEEIETKEIMLKQQRTDELEGKTYTERQMRVILPVKAQRECYRQLNEAVAALGFAAEPENKSLPKGRLNIPEPE